MQEALIKTGFLGPYSFIIKGGFGVFSSRFVHLRAPALSQKVFKKTLKT
jgi:hypothetical protein